MVSPCLDLWWGGPFVVAVAIIEGVLGWRVSMILLGGGLLIVGIPLALVARPRPEPYGYLPDGATLEEARKDEMEEWGLGLGRASDGFTVVQAVSTRDSWVLTVLFAFMFMGISGLMVHLIPMLEDMNYSSAQAAGILGLMFLLSGIGRIGSGLLADMIEFRVVLAGLIACQLVGLVLLSVIGPSQIWLVGIFALTFGIGFGGTVPLRPFLIVQIFGTRAFGSLQGLVQGGAIGAGMVGPVFYGWAFDTRGSYDLAIYASLATIVVAIPLTYLLRKPREIIRRPNMAV